MKQAVRVARWSIFGQYILRCVPPSNTCPRTHTFSSPSRSALTHTSAALKALQISISIHQSSSPVQAAKFAQLAKKATLTGGKTCNFLDWRTKHRMGADRFDAIPDFHCMLCCMADDVICLVKGSKFRRYLISCRNPVLIRINSWPRINWSHRQLMSTCLRAKKQESRRI
jgi:hypothetical protein